METLDNYHALLAKVDQLAAAISSKYPEHITCHSGCSSCCRHLSLSVVEGVALAVALGNLAAAKAEVVRARARAATKDGACPLLHDDRCALYANRPVICRTHGLPLLLDDNGRKTVDFCPLNFTGVTSLPGDAIVALDQLNTVLAAINKLFVAKMQMHGYGETDRLTIAEALLLEL